MSALRNKVFDTYTPIRRQVYCTDRKMSEFTGVPGTKQERTFIAIKTDGVQRGLIGEIIKRFEQRGFKLVGLKMIHATEEQAAGHYHHLREKKFFKNLVEYFSSGPIVAMCWEGSNVVKCGRMILGATNPCDSSPGTIRGDFAIDTGRNVCHGSDAPETAVNEIKYWFKPEEIMNWTSVQVNQVYE
uniref:Nucleoside diphosphate kinase n=1 Tax=Lygus hesperus TaxID=30085 RepID=A0A0A9WX06_LYGHE